MELIRNILIVILLVLIGLWIWRDFFGSRAIVSSGDQLPRGVTEQSIREARSLPRSAEAMDPQWTLHGNWQDSPMFQRGGAYEIQQDRNGNFRCVGRLCRNPFSRTPPPPRDGGFR